MGDKDFDMTDLRQTSINLHEMYQELKHAGFARSEALELIARTIAYQTSNVVKDDDDE